MARAVSQPTPPRSEASAASRVVLGRGMLYTAGTAAPVLSNAIVAPFVTRSLDGPSYGVVATSLVLIQIGMIVGGLGLGAAITRHGILEQSGIGGARTLVLRGAIISAIFGAVGAATAAWTTNLLGIHEPRATALAFLASAGFAVVVNAQSYLRVLDRPAPFVLLSLTAALGGPVVGLVLVVTWQATSAAYLSGLVAGYLAAAGVGLAVVLGGGAAVHQRGDLRKALRVGFPTVPHQVALYLSSGILVLIAGWVFDQTQAGRLQLAVLVGSAPGVLTASLNNAWAPVVYRTRLEHRGAVLEQTGRDIGFLTSLAAGFVAIAAPFLLAIVAPPSLDPQQLTPATSMVAAGTVLSVPYLCNVHLVFVSGRSTGLALVTPASLLVGTGAAFLAAHLFGLVATSIGMTVTYLCLALGTRFLARVVSPTRWRMRALASPVLLGGALCVIGATLPTEGPALYLRGALAALLIAASLMALLRVRTR